jgi:hypothetical protein
MRDDHIPPTDHYGNCLKQYIIQRHPKPEYMAALRASVLEEIEDNLKRQSQPKGIPTISWSTPKKPTTRGFG